MLAVERKQTGYILEAEPGGLRYGEIERKRTQGKCLIFFLNFIYSHAQQDPSSRKAVLILWKKKYH